jgi:hypothetical protein
MEWWSQLGDSHRVVSIILVPSYSQGCIAEDEGWGQCLLTVDCLDMRKWELELGRRFSGSSQNHVRDTILGCTHWALLHEPICILNTGGGWGCMGLRTESAPTVWLQSYIYGAGTTPLL